MTTVGGGRKRIVHAESADALYATGNYRSPNGLGKADGTSGARASALLDLLLMAPEVIAQLDVPKEEAARLAERHIRRLAR